MQIRAAICNLCKINLCKYNLYKSCKYTYLIYILTSEYPWQFCHIIQQWPAEMGDLWVFLVCFDVRQSRTDRLEVWAASIEMWGWLHMTHSGHQCGAGVLTPRCGSESSDAHCVKELVKYLILYAIAAVDSWIFIQFLKITDNIWLKCLWNWLEKGGDIENFTVRFK